MSAAASSIFQGRRTTTPSARCGSRRLIVSGDRSRHAKARRPGPSSVPSPSLACRHGSSIASHASVEPYDRACDVEVRVRRRKVRAPMTNGGRATSPPSGSRRSSSARWTPGPAGRGGRLERATAPPPSRAPAVAGASVARGGRRWEEHGSSTRPAPSRRLIRRLARRDGAGARRRRAARAWRERLRRALGDTVAALDATVGDARPLYGKSRAPRGRPRLPDRRAAGLGRAGARSAAATDFGRAG